MDKPSYIHDEPTGNKLLKKLLIVLLVLVLIAGIGFGLYIIVGNQQAATVLDDFKQSLAESRYDDAIAYYRMTQEQSLTSSWLDQHQEIYQAALTEMETLTDAQLQLIENRLLQNQTLTVAELAFAEKMAEVTAAPLISFLRQLCADYIGGKLEMQTIKNAFAQLAPLKNLNDAIGGLPSQFEIMTLVRPLVIDAEAEFAAFNYWAAWNGYEAILDNPNLTGFVLDNILLRQQTCERAMYKPLLDEAHGLMAGGRYLSAQTALEKMAAVFADDPVIQADLTECAGYVPAELFNTNKAIEVLSVKPLIVNTSEAFDGDSYADAANDSMLTVKEFKTLLEELYANDYMLIDSNRIYTADRQLAQIKLPIDKKPLVLVLEGLNYYATRRQTGNCWDLVLDEGGEVCGEYMDENGRMVVSREAEAIGILDLFVAAHPDFSLDGAKGTISLTGYECIFGSVTNADQLDDRNTALQDNGFSAVSLSEAEIAANYQRVQTIIDRLKNTGWLFASSTYGYINANDQLMERIQTDTGKWLDQVGSLTGPVSFLNYPNGSYITGSDERAVWLKSQGFILFGGLGTTAYLYAGSDYIYVDKTPVNGYTLRNSAKYHLDLMFDAAKVLDTAARPSG